MFFEAGFHEIEDSNWRAEEKRKRRPCHHVAPPGAVQPRPRDRTGAVVRCIYPSLVHFHRLFKSVSTFGRGRSGGLNESLFENLSSAYRALRGCFRNVVRHLRI